MVVLADGAGDFGMTYAQALKGVKAQRCVMDLFGTFAATFECTSDPRCLCSVMAADGVR